MKKGKKGLLAALAVLAVIVAMTVPAIAGPVGTASGFEDDDANLVVDSTFDWNGFATTTWNGTAPYRTSDKVAGGWTFKGLEDAQATTTDTAFAGGTKQDDNCPTVNTGKAPNKDDLKRIYLSTKVVGGHTYLNLAWVRIQQNTTSPSAHVGFEFNKGTDGLCGGSSDGLVKRVAGDMLIVYDFEGGATDTPVISIRRWVTSGTCDVGSDSPPCWGPATNVSALGFAEARVNTSASVVDAIAPSPPQTLGKSEFGEAGIDLTDAGVFSAGTCESFGTAFGVSRSSGNSGTAQMKDLVGPAPFTLANCGTVIIRKVTDPAGDTSTSFGYTTNVTTTPSTTTSPFSLKDGEHNTIENVNPGSGLTVTEDDPSPNYQLDSIDCSASTVPAANYSTDTTTRAVTFSIAAGETLDCTFTNKLQQGAIKITKTSSKTDAGLEGATFSITKDGSPISGSPFTTDSDGVICVDDLAFGDYVVTETGAPDGYAIDDDTGHTVTVDNNAKCDDDPYVGEEESFTDTPVYDLQVNFRDGGSGETSATIECSLDPADSTDAASGWDTSSTYTGREAPDTVTCTITVDP